MALPRGWVGLSIKSTVVVKVRATGVIISFNLVKLVADVFFSL